MANAAGAPLPRGLMMPGDHLNAQSLAADDSAGLARINGAIAAALALIALAVSPRPSFGLAAIVAAAAVAAAHQFWTAHVHVARREALGDAADAANGLA
jgi:hypothetical protein